MEALQRRATNANATLTTLLLLRHRRRRSPGQMPHARRPRSVALPVRAVPAEGYEKGVEVPCWLNLASKVTALALAVAISASPVVALALPTSCSSSSTSSSTTTATLPRSLVVTSQIDYERVARARSAVEKRMERNESNKNHEALSETSTSTVTTTTSKQQQRDDYSSELPSPDEADALLQFDREAYTDDAWEAMKTIRAYASYVESLSELESSPGCELCAANRHALERVWQTVSQEYYPPPGRAFSQAAWAARLPAALRASGGVLRDAATARAAARDLVASLGDRYTEYLGPEAYRAALRRPLARELAYAAARAAGGVGIVVEGPSSASGNGGARVAAVLAESTAEAAGVEPGDVLLEVEGHAAARLRVEELGALLRGPAGSAARVVVLKQQRQQQRQQTEGDSPPRLSSPAVLFFPPSSTVSRPAFPLMLRVKAAATAAITKAAPPSPPKMLTLDLERKPIPQPPVKTAPLSSPKGRSIAYIRLHYFARDATRALAGALLNAEARGDEGLVLDLRNNPGGVFEEAVADAAMFLKRGATIASTTRTPLSSGSPSSPPSAPPPPVATFIAGDSDNDASPSSLRRAALSSAPMVVLVDAGSASGAEVLAGALADNGRAVLVGPRRTFGKGLIQYYFLVDDEGSRAGKKNRSGDGGVAGGIKVTVAGYSTPKGHDPSAERGLEPQRWCSGHGSGPPGSSSWASTAPSPAATATAASAAGASDSAAEVEDGCLIEALRAVDDEIDRAGGADATAALARF